MLFEAGDYVKAYDETTGVYVYGTITWIDNNNTKLAVIETSNGREITVDTETEIDFITSKAGK